MDKLLLIAHQDGTSYYAGKIGSAEKLPILLNPDTEITLEEPVILTMHTIPANSPVQGHRGGPVISALQNLIVGCPIGTPRLFLPTLHLRSYWIHFLEDQVPFVLSYLNTLRDLKKNQKENRE